MQQMKQVCVWARGAEEERHVATLLSSHIGASALPQEQLEATDTFPARTMTGSHLVFGKTTPLQCGGDRLVGQRGIRDSEQEGTGPGRVNGA